MSVCVYVFFLFNPTKSVPKTNCVGTLSYATTTTVTKGDDDDDDYYTIKTIDDDDLQIRVEIAKTAYACFATVGCSDVPVVVVVKALVCCKFRAHNVSIYQNANFLISRVGSRWNESRRALCSYNCIRPVHYRYDDIWLPRTRGYKAKHLINRVIAGAVIVVGCGSRFRR